MIPVLDLSWAVHKYGILLILLDPLAATVYLMAPRIGPKGSTSNSNGTIGPIRDTIKSNLAAIGIEKLRKT